MIVRLKYIQKFMDHNGHTRVYLRRKGHKPIPLPDLKDPEFFLAYQTALASIAPPEKKIKVDPASLDALVDGYYKTAKFLQLGDSTQAVYRRIIRSLCVKHGSKPVATLTTQAIRKAMDARVGTPAAANHFLRTLRALMQFAVEQGKIQTDPTFGVKRLKEVASGAETWTEDDIAKYEVRHPLGTKARLGLALCLFTGQRRSDVVRLGRQMVSGDLLTFSQVKTKTKMEIPIHPALQEVIDASVPAGQMIFLLGENGKPYDANAFYMRLKHWSEQAGLPADRSPHGLRKAACRRLAEAGCSEDQIAAISGHLDMDEIRIYVRAANRQKMARQAIHHLGRPGV